jgi:hypothetical protein
MCCGSYSIVLEADGPDCGPRHLIFLSLSAEGRNRLRDTTITVIQSKSSKQDSFKVSMAIKSSKSNYNIKV